MIAYGILGFGSFADRTIAPAFSETRFSKLAALQKRDPDEARRTADRWSCRAYTDPAELVRSPDLQAVFLTGVNSTRCAETVLAAEAGKHVLVEKPMAMNAAECRRMIDACAAHRVRLMVAQMIRFSPAVRKIRDLVGSGRLGRVISMRGEFVFPAERSSRTWITDRKLSGGGPIFDIGVHCLDTMRYILGDEVEAVGALRRPEPDETHTESTAEMILRFRGGVMANIMVSFETDLRTIVLEVVGSKGSVTCRNFSLSKFSPTLSLTEVTEPEHPRTTESTIEVGNLYAAEIDHFSRCIMDGSDPLVPGEEGLKNQMVLDAAMAVAATVVPA